MTTTWKKQFDLSGPCAAHSRLYTLAEARTFCRELALSHYENFTVASRLLPKRLRQHFCNVYAFCRWADNLGDEIGSPEQSLSLLDWWEEQLAACFRDEPLHPVMVALHDTVREFSIPMTPFQRLIAAFRADQTTTRYQTLTDLLAYCANSANPVGEIVLYLGECHAAHSIERSDCLCTGLQLANFAQDVARDYALGRVYLPTEFFPSGTRFDWPIPLADRQEITAAVKRFSQVAAERFQKAEPLIAEVSESIRLPVAMFLAGGRATLAVIRRQNFQVCSQRPTVSSLRKISIWAKCLWQTRRLTGQRVVAP